MVRTKGDITRLVSSALFVTEDSRYMYNSGKAQDEADKSDAFLSVKNWPGFPDHSFQNLPRKSTYDVVDGQKLQARCCQKVW